MTPGDLVFIRDELSDGVLGLIDDVKIISIPNGSLAIVIRTLESQVRDADEFSKPTPTKGPSPLLEAADVDVIVLYEGKQVKVWDVECELVPT
jgi:hypothetical protein